MNILHVKYAVEIANLGSINKASEVLFVAQPNLSRAVKELEADLGIVIFDRSAKGMVPTIEGRQFLEYAKQILHQIDEVEHLFKYGKEKKKRFAVSVPRSAYISEAFSKFSKCIDAMNVNIFYKETNSWRAINNILSSLPDIMFLTVSSRLSLIFFISGESFIISTASSAGIIFLIFSNITLFHTVLL